MRIGVDFDNTLACYDRAFATVGKEHGLLPPSFIGGKEAAKRFLLSEQPDGCRWERLQGLVYGQHIDLAEVYEGAAEFFRRCRERDGWEVYIVSHKGEYAKRDPSRTDLRESALGWMARQGFFKKDGFGLDLTRVFFEDTREAKVRRIGKLDCQVFVDDHPEVLGHEAMPAGCRKILFSTEFSAEHSGLFERAANWAEVCAAIFRVPDAVVRAADRLSPAPVRTIEEVRKGGNSRVFKIVTAAGPYALKQYPADDRRDRQGAEARALAFVARAGLGRTPRLIAADHDAHASLLSWVEGTAIPEVSGADVAQFAQFQIDLDRAIDGDARRDIGPAAEACISGERILSHIRRRHGPLAAFGGELPELGTFMQSRFLPALTAYETRARSIYGKLGLDFAGERPLAAQTLIASDFGAHNALRGADGKLTFLDFEYFGWDDPLTSIGNFVLHPGMNLTHAQRTLYRDRLLAHFGPAHAERLAALLPLFALRWCAIVLSDLLPERRAHRAAARSRSDDIAVLAARQLSAADRLLGELEAC